MIHQGQDLDASTQMHPFLFCAVHDFDIRAKHFPGQQNVIAESISCNNLEVLFKEAPSGQHKQTAILLQVWELLTSQQ